MNNEKKIILEQEDFNAIVTYLRSVPVAFDRIDAAAAVKACIGRAMLADIKFENKPGEAGFPAGAQRVASPSAPENEPARAGNGSQKRKNPIK